MKKIFVLLLLLSSITQAKTWPHRSINVYQAQGIHNSLKYIVPEALGGDLSFQPTYLVGLSYTQLTHAYEMNNGASQLQFGFEVVGAKHYGEIQHIEELVGFYFIKYAGLFSPKFFLNTDITFGEGFSYTFGEATFDDDAFDEPGKKYTLLNHFLLDFDFYLNRYDRVKLFFRVHHRCGIYGLIAPSNVGSSFWGTGLRYLF